MRWALENQPGDHERIRRNHQQWRELWQSASQEPLDERAALIWYHDYCLEPSNALRKWNQLAEAARTAVPPRMRDHFEPLRWWDPIGLLEEPRLSSDEAWALSDLGMELWRATLGRRDVNLRQAIACYEAALRIYTEIDFPREHELVLQNLGPIQSNS